MVQSLVMASALVLSAVVAAPAAAQTYRPERPYRGLFGSGVGETQQSLIASGSIGAGWDNDLVADAAGARSSSGAGRFRGGLGTTSGAIAYALNGTRYGFGASANTALNYYPDLRDRFVRRDYLSSSATAIVTSNLSVHAGASYRPYTASTLYPVLFAPRPGDVGIEDEDIITELEHYFSYSAGTSYGREVSRRGNLTANYDYRGRAASASIRRFDSHSAGLTYTHGLTRGLQARAGYHYTTGYYTNRGSRDQHHVIDAGLNYSHALSFSRRTTFSFSTGTTATRPSGSTDIRYYATGSARVSHDLGRTWELTGGYNRGVQFVESWPEPVFSDAGSVGIGGQLHRRLQFQATARAVRGTGRAGVASNRMTSYRGVAQLGIGISRYVSGSVSYFYDRHDIGSGLIVPAGYPRFRDRQGVRVALTAWAPLFTQRKR